MIKQISEDALHQVDHLIDEYSDSRPANPFSQSVSFKERIVKGLEGEALGLFAYLKEENAIGCSVVGLKSGGINLIYISKDVEDNFEIKRKLFNHAFDLLSKDFSLIRIGNDSVCSKLSKYTLSKGFDKFDRKHMTLSRSSLLSYPDRDLPEGYNYRNYQSSDKDEMANLLHEANIGNVDIRVFPNFFGSFAAASSLIENIENSVYGEYKDGHSLILRKDDESVGVIFLTLISPDTGYIPAICIRRNHRRKGLGRALLVSSIKRMAEKEQGMEKMNLDVTIENPARLLYESMGFEDVREYSMYLFNKDS